MTAPWLAQLRSLAGRTLRSPVPAPEGEEMRAHRQPLRYKARARPDVPRYRASPSPAVLRRVTFQQRACRFVTPSAGRVRVAGPGRWVRRPALRAAPRPRRSTQTRPGLRPMSPAVRSQVSADPPRVRSAAAAVRLEPLAAMPVRSA